VDRLRSLEVFKAVAERGSFVKAAESLNLSNPVVTRAVQDLESMLGVRLLQRSTRRVSVTAEGQAVLERARVLLASFDELSATSSLSASEAAGEIRFTAPASFGATRLGPVLAAFTIAHPKVRLDLLLTDTPLDLIEDGIDLALRVASDLPDSLIARRIGDACIGVFAAPGYLREKGIPKHPGDLAQHRCLAYKGAGRHASWRFLHPVTQERIEPAVRGSLSANNAEALQAAAVHGSGLVMLPHFLAEEAVARGDLEQVLSQWRTPPLGVYLAYSSRRNQPLRVRKLIDHLAQAFGGDDDAVVQPVRRKSGAARRGELALPQAVQVA
jgi:LysR family transcriptional regulator, regulator for bpeEF and oprC